MAALLPATLTIREARAALGALQADVARGSGALAVDAGALTSFDTSAIAVLLELHRQAQGAGRTLQISGAPAPMVELAGLYGVADLLGLNDAQPDGRANGQPDGQPNAQSVRA
jgi:phospholipid transport system transporter-binding protein